MGQSVHLVGEEENGIRGHKIRKIKQETKTSINISRCCRRKSVPMIITISGKGVTGARRLIMERLLEFLADPGSARRLVYEMGMSAEGTFQTQKVNFAVEQECHRSQKLVWMKLLEFSSQELDGKLIYHGHFLLSDNLQRELIHDTTCCIEVYGFKDDIPMMSGPYVFIYGNGSDEVNEVAARVACLIKQHQQRCPVGFQVEDDSSCVIIENDISVHKKAPKRKTLSNTEKLSDHSNPNDFNYERPRKALKVMEKTFIFTVPLWIMQHGNDLYGKPTFVCPISFFNKCSTICISLHPQRQIASMLR
jgi:hypothetical protein